MRRRKGEEILFRHHRRRRRRHHRVFVGRVDQKVLFSHMIFALSFRASAPRSCSCSSLMHLLLLPAATTVVVVSDKVRGRDCCGNEGTTGRVTRHPRTLDLVLVKVANVHVSGGMVDGQSHLFLLNNLLDPLRVGGIAGDPRAALHSLLREAAPGEALIARMGGGRGGECGGRQDQLLRNWTHRRRRGRRCSCRC